jgi:putative DNA primase/helicase
MTATASTSEVSKARKSVSPDLLGFHFSDYGNAQRLLQAYGRDIHYCPPMRRFLLWDGYRFKLDERDEIHRLMQNVMLEFCGQAVEARNDAATKFAGSCLNGQRIAAAIREAQPLVAVLPHELDLNPYFLNFLNGTLDLRTGALEPPQRSHLLTKLISYEYDPRARCERFLAFLSRAVGEAGVPHLQKVLGYALTADTTEKCCFLLLGPTNSGKTTLLNLFRSQLIPEYAAKIGIDSLMSRELDNAARSDLADLRGVRFVMTSETEEGNRLKEGRLKTLVQGQGTYKTSRKYENTIEFKESWKLFVDANHKPVIKGTDDSIWRRLVVIPFPHTIPDDEIDPELPAKLEREAEGILAWAVAGAQRWQSERLQIPADWLLAREEWRTEADDIGHFLEACCVVNTNCSSAGRPLYQAYRLWAEGAGESPITEKSFAMKLAERFEKKKGRASNMYVGVGLRADHEQSELHMEEGR